MNILKESDSELALRSKEGGFRKKLSRKYRSFRHRGTSYLCNVCDKRFGRFLSSGVDEPVLVKNNVVGGGRRDNVKCPECNSADRTRLILHYLQAESDISSGSTVKVLHVAPEISLMRKLRDDEAFDLLTVDLHQPYVDEKMDITDIGKPDNSFDIVICSHVLEHVPDDALAMRELKRVLKPNGFAILQVPISFTNEQTIEDDSVSSDADRLLKFGQTDHVRIYGQDYLQRLSDAGFIVEKYLPPEESLKKLGLNPKEYLFVGRHSSL